MVIVVCLSTLFLSPRNIKVNVVCGLIKPAIIYLRDLIPRLKLSEQLGALSFDEVKIKESAVHDVKLDAFLGPNNYAQVILVRSLLGKWKFPVFCRLSRHSVTETE